MIKKRVMFSVDGDDPEKYMDYYKKKTFITSKQTGNYMREELKNIKSGG